MVQSVRDHGREHDRVLSDTDCLPRPARTGLDGRGHWHRGVRPDRDHYDPHPHPSHRQVRVQVDVWEVSRR